MENWKDIPGFEGLYQVSDLGRVRSVSRFVRAAQNKEFFKAGRILKPDTSGDYLMVNFSVNGLRKHFRIHRLVAMAFLPAPKYGVNHKDGNKRNNHISNLEWCTSSENELHSYKVLGKVSSMLGKKGKTGKDNPTSKPVICITTNENFDSMSEAGIKLNVDIRKISAVCRGKRKTTGGLKFKYA